jgi:hypothetical protein
VNQFIPFLGYLIGMAYLGHSVVVFEGHPSALSIACRDADLLIVDGAMLQHLQKDRVTVATSVLRKRKILVFGRDGKIAEISAKPQQS